MPYNIRLSQDNIPINHLMGRLCAKPYSCRRLMWKPIFHGVLTKPVAGMKPFSALLKSEVFDWRLLT
ncbi:hypothetical protein X474_16960 [Dethiosulfatarculus sandiegensis]|uniref:Uncharacterized protein n=1 Tax=Dethiosulfatarculus sandiegensis TaxID=1429043 RepID=A0A0D2JTJ0_9BACT|nr:hypothetical protein X474_16960 [Dethiosulfatarculus sandiegensis]